MTDRTGNLPTFPGVYPNYMAPVVCHQPEGRELAMVRWGMPTPAYVLLKGKPKGTGARSIREPVRCARDELFGARRRTRAADLGSHLMRVAHC
jgi:hypothetical protein